MCPQFQLKSKPLFPEVFLLKHKVTIYYLSCEMYSFCPYCCCCNWLTTLKHTGRAIFHSLFNWMLSSVFNISSSEHRHAVNIALSHHNYSKASPDFEYLFMQLQSSCISLLCSMLLHSCGLVNGILTPLLV